MREFTYHVGQHVAPMDQAEHIPTEHMSKVVACRRDDNDHHFYQLSAPTGGFAFDNDGTVPANYFWDEDEIQNMDE